MMTFVAALCIGFLLNDVSVYSWHRWVSHAGALRWIGNDLFRRRHFHHHLVQYPPHQLRARAYIESCDVTFATIEVVLLLGLTVLISIGATTLSSGLAALCGGMLHGTLALHAHKMCHGLPGEAQIRHLKNDLGVIALERLSRFHDAHHTSRGNYGLLLPFIDIVAGTRTRCATDPNRLAIDLFPGFLPELSSSCDEPLL